MAQSVWIPFDEPPTSQLAAIAGDQSRPFKRIVRALSILRSTERLNVERWLERQGTVGLREGSGKSALTKKA
ncbi:hypothetical protein ASF32_12985 [Methylobacterium sp. Leaf91]|nr:hypothetical protein ASF24_00020 [Methylobacterium sp. Leaf86]KQO99975.1 hypothetical protein ASF32_12985 [Methylobacterium sp. Leaf91]